MVGHDESPQPRHVGVGALPRDEEVVGVPAREGEATDGRQRAQLGILEKEKNPQYELRSRKLDGGVHATYPCHIYPHYLP